MLLDSRVLSAANDKVTTELTLAYAANSTGVLSDVMESVVRTGCVYQN